MKTKIMSNMSNTKILINRSLKPFLNFLTGFILILFLFSPYAAFAFNSGNLFGNSLDDPFGGGLPVAFDTDNPPQVTFGFGNEPIRAIALPTITIHPLGERFGEIVDLGPLNIAPLTNLREIADLTEVINGIEFGYTIDESGIQQELYSLTVEFGDDGLKATIELPNEPFVLENVLGKDYKLDKIEIATAVSGDWTLKGSKDGEDVLTIEHFVEAKSKDILGEEFERVSIEVSTIITIYGDEDKEGNILTSRETGFDEEENPVYQKDEYETPADVTTEEGEAETATVKLTLFNPDDGSRIVTYFDQEGNMIAQETISGTFGAAAGPGESSSFGSFTGVGSPSDDTLISAPPGLDPTINNLVTQSPAGTVVNTPSTAIPDPPTKILFSLGTTNDTRTVERSDNLGFQVASTISNNPGTTGGNRIVTSPFVTNNDIELINTNLPPGKSQRKILLAKATLASPFGIETRSRENANVETGVADEIVEIFHSREENEKEVTAASLNINSPVGVIIEDENTEGNPTRQTLLSAGTPPSPSQSPSNENNATVILSPDEKLDRKIVTIQIGRDEEVLSDEEIGSLFTFEPSASGKIKLLEDLGNYLSGKAADEIMKLLSSGVEIRQIIVLGGEIRYITAGGEEGTIKY